MTTLLEVLIEQFKTNTYGKNCEGQRKWLKDNSPKFSTPLADEDLCVALALAHNDMARRANGHTNEVKVASVKWLYDHFTKNSPFGIKSQAKFDTWHDKTCGQYCLHMKAQTFPKKFDITYGRAQKVLNMTFKYLYCTTNYKSEVVKIVEYLHMTLDSYTLRWYKDAIVIPTPGLNAGDISNWSKMNEPYPKHQYIDLTRDEGIQKGIQNRIRDFLSQPSPMYEYTIDTESIGEIDQTDDEESGSSKKKKSKKITVSLAVSKHPFFAEFVIWRGEIIRAKMEALFSGLNGFYKTLADDTCAINANITAELKAKIGAILANL